ncbi:MAG: SRPBCC family protein [Pseudomonadales bacterium]
MEQSGEHLIQADRETVWQALNNPDVLARSIEGCQAMRKLNDEHFQARVKAKIGPVSATFDLDLQLSDVQPPASYRIEGKVKGGPAGFGKGTAEVSLQEEAQATRLSYGVQASVGGKLAQVGSRLLDGAARKMADDFFAAFSELVGGGSDLDNLPVGEAFAPDAAVRESSGQWVIWAVAFGVLALALILAL